MLTQELGFFDLGTDVFYRTGTRGPRAAGEVSHNHLEHQPLPGVFPDLVYQRSEVRPAISTTWDRLQKELKEELLPCKIAWGARESLQK